jgi:hypothetical protein
MRYGIALVVALAILLFAGLFTWRTKRIVHEELRKSLREAKAAGTLPPELQHLDPDTERFEEVGIELPAVSVTRITIADLILAYWLVLGPLVILLCLGTAALSCRLAKPKDPLQGSSAARKRTQDG